MPKEKIYNQTPYEEPRYALYFTEMQKVMFLRFVIVTLHLQTQQKQTVDLCDFSNLNKLERMITMFALKLINKKISLIPTKTIWPYL